MTDDELELLRQCYRRLSEPQKGKTTCTQYDPAGSEYSFEEYDWSIKIRELLNITYEPTGV